MDDLRTQAAEFWAIVVEVWNTSFLGYNVGDGLAALLIIAIAFLVRGVFSRVVMRRFIARAEKTESKLDDKLVKGLAGPVKLIPVIVGIYIAFHFLNLHSEDAPVDGGQVTESLVIIALFWALRNAVEPVAYLSKPIRNTLNPVMIDWLAKALKIFFVIVGAAAVLQVWGIPVAPVIGGLGLLGVAIGLGAQDLFKNLIAGLLILTEKRFVPGEWIMVDGVVEGTVEQINFRSTLVRRFDKSPVYVPNADLADNAVVNFTRMTHRRIKWAIGVEYKTTTAQLQYIRDHVLDYIMNHPEFARPPEVATFMRVDSFGPSSIDFLLYCFTKTTNWGEWLRLKEELAFEVKRIVEDGAGTAFAFPSTTVYLDDGAEIFTPPQVAKHSGGPAQSPPRSRPEKPKARRTAKRAKGGKADAGAHHGSG
ncbi:MAG: mechanosensitive ion channel family protein [Oceanicaulis sp.]